MSSASMATIIDGTGVCPSGEYFASTHEHRHSTYEDQCKDIEVRHVDQGDVLESPASRNQQAEGGSPSDGQDLEALKTKRAKLLAQKQLLEDRLNALRVQVSRTRGQNSQIKKLVGCLNVCKDDFTQLHAPPNGKQEEAMLAVGSRLLNAVCPADVVASPIAEHSRSATRASHLLQAQHPEEAQIAAAALVACGNDPAAAIVALMEAAEQVQQS